MASLSFAIAFILEENLVNGEDLQGGGHSFSTGLPSESASGLGATTKVVPEVGTKAKFGIWDPEITGFGTGGNFFIAHLAEGVVWGGVLALGIKYIGPMLGLSDEASNAATL